jgi:hypothetical protein
MINLTETALIQITLSYAKDDKNSQASGVRSEGIGRLGTEGAPIINPPFSVAGLFDGVFSKGKEELDDRLLDRPMNAGQIREELKKRDVNVEVNIVQAAKNAKLSPAQIVDFFCRIDKSVGWLSKGKAFDAVPDALKAKLDQDQILGLYSKINNNCEENTRDAFAFLSFSFENARRAKLSPEQIVTLFGKIVDKNKAGASKVFDLLPLAMEAAKKARLNPDQITALFGEIAERAPEVLEDVPNALSAVRKAKISTADIFRLFIQLVSITGKCAKIVFKEFPEMIESLLDDDAFSVDGIIKAARETMQKGKWLDACAGFRE